MNNYFNYLCPVLPAGILLNQILVSYVPKPKSSQCNEKKQSQAKQITLNYKQRGKYAKQKDNGN